MKKIYLFSILVSFLFFFSCNNEDTPDSEELTYQNAIVKSTLSVNDIESFLSRIQNIKFSDISSSYSQYYNPSSKREFVEFYKFSDEKGEGVVRIFYQGNSNNEFSNISIAYFDEVLNNKVHSMILAQQHLRGGVTDCYKETRLGKNDWAALAACVFDKVSSWF